VKYTELAGLSCQEYKFGGGLSPPDRPVGVPFGRSGRGSGLNAGSFTVIRN
jgi:hypothetical protein